jgi:tRNA 2-thiouridine synthesizing protein A
VKRLRVDLCGEVCPYTFVRAKLALEDDALAVGDELELLLDHEPARRSLPRALREEGHEVLGIAEAGAGFLVTVRKRAPVPVDDL